MSLDVKITKRFDGFTLRTEFTAGNTTAAILGASGCGKSMTLRCIAGIVRPDSGRIVLDGRVLFDSEQGIDLPPQQRNVGLLFQNYALFPNMTVEQNVLCALKKEKDPTVRKAACAEALRAMRLEELAHRLPSELSGGQQQRAALARILAGRPRIISGRSPPPVQGWHPARAAVLFARQRAARAKAPVCRGHGRAAQPSASPPAPVQQTGISRLCGCPAAAPRPSG